MKKSLHLFLLAAVALLSASCATLRPIASSVSEPDYNQRVRVSNARFKKSPNAIGITVGVALPVAGAVGGYYSGLVQDYDLMEGRVPVPARGAVMGALVGTGLSALSAMIAGYGTRTGGDMKTWARRAGHYILLDENGNDLVLIDPAAEDSYTVKNLQDVRDFAIAFPHSRYAEGVIDQALAVLPRESFPVVESMFPGSPSLGKLALRYIETSRSFKELDEAFKLYPTNTLDREKLYFDRIASARDATSFRERFPSSGRMRQAVVKAFSTANSKDALTGMSRAYGRDIVLESADFKGVSSELKRNYYDGMFTLADCRNMEQLNRFNEQFAWLGFDGKREAMLEKAWGIAERNSRKGSEIISQLGTLVGTPYAKSVGLNTQSLQAFCSGKLKQVAEKEVQIVSTHTTSSVSDEFQRWRNAGYSAGLVTQKGVTYLVYGEVKNNSKFDLPVSLSFSGTLTQKVQMENTGLGALLNLAGKLAGMGGIKAQPMRASLNLHNYQIPVLKAGTSCIYAAAVTFDEDALRRLGQNGIAAGGGNLGDLVKISSELVLEGVKVRAAYSEEKPSAEQLKRQGEWQAFVKNGLPGGTLIDFARNTEYRQATWDKEWAEIQKRAAQRAAQSSSSSSSKSSSRTSSSSSSSSSSRSDPLPEGKKMHTCRVQIYFKDGAQAGDTLYDSKITAYWGSDTFFGTLFHADFETDGNGWATISWPADEGDEIIEIFFTKGFIMPEGYDIKPLNLKPGSVHRLNADSYINH